MLSVGLAQIDITPRSSVSLAGYFNKRISKGVLDRLYAKVVILEKNNVTLAIVVLDLLGLSSMDVDKIKKRIYKRFDIPGEHIIISCTHTHTGPATFSLFEVERDRQFVRKLIPSIETVFSRAIKNKKPTEIYITKIEEKGLSFNRRYIMKNGSVVTNPPKRSPDVLKPEGPVDRLITTLIFTSRSRIIGILVNATNHVDTIGSDMISSDWPGHLAYNLNKKLKREIPVLVLTGAAGNINHFNPHSPTPQTSYQESQRIGKAYSRYVLKSLRRKIRIKDPVLFCIAKELRVPYRKIDSVEIKNARNLLKLSSSIPYGSEH